MAVASTHRQYPTNPPPLMPEALTFLPLGAIRPRGWLREQLRIQASGLSGHLPEFWPSLGPDSGWLGGSGESWERGPYYMDGLVPLAFLLEDPKLIDEAHRWVGWSLDHQAPDGWLGPQGNRDWWPRMVLLKAMTQYQEATGDPRVIPAMERFFKMMRAELPNRPLQSWAAFRWQEMVLSVRWLYVRTGDKCLLDLPGLLRAQGYDWDAHFADFRYRDRGKDDKAPQKTHVVNNAMAVKAPALMCELTGDERYRKAIYRCLEMLDAYHGQATGVFTGDEHYAGRNPSQGTETCAVVEYLWSLENLLRVLGDPAFGDRLERIAFNALPAPFSPDMWAHQYDQQANQVVCRVSEDRLYVSNGKDANLFGLEPNYGCCTANMHQGWPKFASHLWMAAPEGGLAAVSYAPCEVKARVKGGSDVTVDVETDYPFDETVTIRVRTTAPVRFPLKLRIPSWAKGAEARIEGREKKGSGTFCAQAPFGPTGKRGLTPFSPGAFATIDRAWKDGDAVELKLPMRVEAERRFHGAVTLTRGPLVYALRIAEQWRQLRGDRPHADWEVLPGSPWNYALAIDPEDPGRSVAFERKTMDGVIFSSAGAPVELRAKGRQLPGWQIEHNAADAPPESPVTSREPLVDLVLIPYGSAKLRLTEFPLLAEQAAGR